MRITTQSARPAIAFYRLNEGSGALELKLEYNAENPAAGSFHVAGYTYKETTGDIAGTFTISIYENLSINGGGSTVWSLLKPLDVVEIKEGGKIFKGVIHTKTFKSAMNGGKVTRTIELAGMSVHSLYCVFTICLDAAAGVTVNAEEAGADLTAAVKDAKTIGELVGATWEHFCYVANAAGATSATYIEKMIAALGMEFDCEEANLSYPVACNFYDASNNTFYDIIKNILNQNAYDCFGYFDADGAPKVKIREKPYDGDKWGELTAHKAPSERLQGFCLNASDAEVYTAFMAYIEGLSVPSDILMKTKLIHQKNDEAQKKTEKSDGFSYNEEKMSKYGYRLLQVNFRGADINQQSGAGENGANRITEENKEKLEALSEKIKGWYENIDEMTCGNFQFVTDMRVTDGFAPSVGEKLTFGDYQFYITEAEHTWRYGEAPITTLSVTRGGVYDKDGNFDAAGSAKGDITRRYSELWGVTEEKSEAPS